MAKISYKQNIYVGRGSGLEHCPVMEEKQSTSLTDLKL